MVDHWTLTLDARNRTLLGLVKDDAGVVGPSGGVKDWSMQSCGWYGDDVCDGSYFLNCANCFGTPVVLEVQAVVE